MKSRALSLAASVFFLAGAASAAAPTTMLRAEYARRASGIKFTIKPLTSATGCTYDLFAGSSAGRVAAAVAGGNPLLTISGSAKARTFTAASLPRVRNRSFSVPFYFQVKTRCGSDTSLSQRVKLGVPASSSRSAVSAPAFQKALKTKLLTSLVTFRQVFSTVDLSAPLDLQPARDGSGRIFVVEQGGRILVLTPNGTSAAASQFLDISSKLSTGGERGLLGLAVHPNFAQNGFIFVNYTDTNGNTVIARFTVSNGDSNHADPNSELQLLHVDQPFENHNGGGLAFGKDGFLYIALGDGGSGGDPQGNAQNRTKLLGKILRIDVDSPSNGKQYGIPPTNPFAGNGSGFREEIFAYGLRNPFRFSVDAGTGVIWAGDVGQNAREEVDVIESGRNYGWNVMEGISCYNASNCDRTGLTLPITDYTHAVGEAITGGYVYRGSAVPELKGRYIYGDFESGRLFALDASRRTDAPVALADTSLNISSFGQDESNELYIVSYSDGKIYRFFER